VARTIRLLITDLDNTLYDWVTFFSASFYAMVRVAAPILEVETEELLDQMRVVHQRHRNSEHPFALLETEACLIRFRALTRRERLAALSPAFEAFNTARADTLRLYPGVAETLRILMKSDCTIVGHTEASAVNAASRLRLLGLEDCISRLYAVRPSGEGHPDPAYVGSLTSWGDRVRLIDEHERKPDIRILIDICREHEVSPHETLYVGDSISRDVGMAKAAGVAAAWAKYGLDYDPVCWKQLVRITHWTAEDVRRTQEAQALYGHVIPDVTLNEFSDILNSFSFGN
jgi:FMN phosphatase YigB (HAD superfamily)